LYIEQDLLAFVGSHCCFQGCLQVVTPPFWLLKRLLVQLQAAVVSISSGYCYACYRTSRRS
jgi:hypothetical protein